MYARTADHRVYFGKHVVLNFHLLVPLCLHSSLLSHMCLTWFPFCYSYYKHTLLSLSLASISFLVNWLRANSFQQAFLQLCHAALRHVMVLCGFVTDCSLEKQPGILQSVVESLFHHICCEGDELLCSVEKSYFSFLGPADTFLKWLRRF